MKNKIEEVDEGYKCAYCGHIGRVYEDVVDHVWNGHKEQEIAACLVRVDGFIKKVSIGYCNDKSHLNLDPDDVSQYLRIEIFMLLRDKFVVSKTTYPKNSDPSTDRLAKASCRPILRYYVLREVMDKKRLMASGSLRHSNNALKDDLHSLEYDVNYWETRTAGSADDPDVRRETVYNHLADKNILVPEDQMHADHLLSKCRTVLNTNERVVFDFLVDDTRKWTQEEIAEYMNITQPMVHLHIKSIREKVKGAEVF